MTDAKAELAKNMADPMWRISNLYKIVTKGDNGETDLVIRFRPNAAQIRFIERLHHRNIILKARQLGFTTLISIMWLDHALFNANSRCGIIAQDLEAAQVIFRDKVKFAYDNLPVALRAAMPLARDSAAELLFAHNNSSVRVATSMRSGTIHRLHVSELGIICARDPSKADEIMTGSIPAVPLNGITIIESTAKGTEGEFHDLTRRAMALQDTSKELNERDYRFHFFPWFGESRYRMSSVGIVITKEDQDHFAAIEAKMSVTLDAEQRAWYVSTRDNDYAGKEEKMLQEYPSTPDEAFQVSTEGNYYAKQIAAVRKSGRILNIPVLEEPVNTFWDIGNSDGCGIWFHQKIGMEDRFIGYHEAHGESLMYYAKVLKDAGYLYNKHFLPHDAAYKKLSDTNKSTEEMLNDLGVINTVIVPVITDLTTGIQTTRKHFASAYFDESGCKDGINRLENYRKRWSQRDVRWTDEPDKANGCSEGADAFRQFAQAKEGGLITMAGRTEQRRPRRAPDWRL